MPRIAAIGRCVALLVGLCLLALWVRSRYVSDLIVFGDAPCTSSSGGSYYELVTIPDQVRLTRASPWVGAQRLRWFLTRDVPPGRPIFGQRCVYSSWLPPGFAVTGGTARFSPAMFGPSRTWAASVNYSLVAIPLPFAVAACAVVALWPLLRGLWRQRIAGHRIQAGLCSICGYDLRASTGRCPECGSSVPAL